MPDLDLRFDEYTERYASRQLDEIREFARTQALGSELILEIGSNRGLFLTRLAQARPDATLLGVELRLKYVRLARRELAEAGVTNAHVLCADANLVLPVVIDDGQLSDLFVLYPDPWWKKRHRKRRIIQPDFLDLLARKMRPGGNVWIRTDVGPLADDMRRTLLEHPEFTARAPVDFPTDGFPRTTREEKCIRKKMPVNLVYFVRR